MAQKKNSNGENLYVLYRTSDNTLLKRNIPESQRAIDLDPGLAYYEMHETRLPRDGQGNIQVDTVYYNVVVTEGLDSQVTPPVYREDEVAEDRPEAEIVALAEDVMMQKAYANIPPNRAIEKLGRITAILHRKAAGVLISADEQAELDAYDDVGEKLLANKANFESIKAQILNGDKPDITLGYQPL